MKRILFALLLAAAMSIPSAALAKPNPIARKPHPAPAALVGHAWTMFAQFIRDHSPIRPQDDAGGHTIPQLSPISGG